MRPHPPPLPQSAIDAAAAAVACHRRRGALLAALATAAPANEGAAAAAAAAAAPPAVLPALRCLQAHAVALEGRPQASAALGEAGVRAAAAALLARPHWPHVRAAAAAALADLCAGAGENKARVIAHPGAISRLLGTAGEGGAAALQACRALGNVCYGWGHEVDAAKAAVGAQGAARLVRVVEVSVALMRGREERWGQTGREAAPALAAGVFRWASHAVRNLAVRSRAMQDAVGAAGGVAALCGGLCDVAVAEGSPRAFESGCKALALVCRGHETNCAAAVVCGALALAAAPMRGAHRADAAAVEAALTLLSAVVGNGGVDAVAAAVRCEAHLASVAAVQALLERGAAERALEGRAAANAGTETLNTDGGDAAHTQLGRPATFEALLGSSVWLLAALAGRVLADAPDTADAAASLQRAGLAATLAAGAARATRGKVRAEVEACLAQLEATVGECAGVKAQASPPKAEPESSTIGLSASDDLTTVLDGIRAAGVRVRELKAAGSDEAEAALAALTAMRETHAAPVEAATREAMAAGAHDSPRLRALLNGLPTGRKRALEKELRRAAKTAQKAVQAETGAHPSPTSGVQIIDSEDARAPSLASPGEDRAAGGVTDADLASCIRVVSALAADEVLATDKRFRALRKALLPLHERHASHQASVVEYERKAQLRREAAARRARQAADDRRHRDTTQLRRGRIQRLQQLAVDVSDEAAGAPPLLTAGDEGAERGDNTGDDSGEGGGGAVSYLSQVPDGAVTAPVAAAASIPMAGGAYPDGEFNPARAAAGREALAAEAAAADGEHSGARLSNAGQCYVCKARFTTLHHFYAQLCPPCAALSFRMRGASEPLEGRVALLTGARVKIGFEIGLKLLRAGATLIATTRFPADAAKRYAAEPDFADWRGRLHLHALDLRDMASLEGFCAYLRQTLERLDIVINNACQTVRRPAAYYSHLLEAERALEAAVARDAGLVIESGAAAQLLTASDGGDGGTTVPAEPGGGTLLPLFAQQVERARQAEGCDAWAAPSAAELSQLRLTGEDAAVTLGAAALPAGCLDVNGQQIDLRTENSWTQRLEDVSTPELAEVMAINAMAPFVINARLQPLLANTAQKAVPGAFIVNVSAMEGKFYRAKTPNHPHTNMAKAALNMNVRTSAPALARCVSSCALIAHGLGLGLPVRTFTIW